ncbi:MAG TPA: hypothetical protein VNQ76_19100 [Planctomicrobium sp.]|nr:hypothetical protein [Planctomicrobium sp.]
MLQNFRLPFVCALCFVMAHGCRSQVEVPGQSVTGTVLVEGEPLSLGLITFRPIDGTRGPKSTARIRNGKFEISAERGPWEGTHQIKISATPPDIAAMESGASHEEVVEKSREPHRLIAKEFDSESQLRFVVKTGEENRCEFQVKWARSKR